MNDNKEIKDYIDTVLTLARKLKTNYSNYIHWSYDDMIDAFHNNTSIKNKAKLLAEETQKFENGGWEFLGDQEYVSYAESKKAAIAVVTRLNKRCNNKWKTISMTKNGNWFADDADSKDMFLTNNAWWSSQTGLDCDLCVKCTSQQNGLFKQSVTKIL